MLKYKKTNITAKTGVNYIRSIVEEAGSLFHKIESENDLGIDALIEFIRDEKPLNSQIAIQIKSGSSYFNPSEQECIIPIGKHRDYWLNHPLPVIGIVYVPALKCAYWLNISDYINSHLEETMIRFKVSNVNRFDRIAFNQLFMPRNLREVPELSLLEAVKYFNSEKPDEFYIGLITIFRRYPNHSETWDAMVNSFKEKKQETIPNRMIYYLAHIPWHPDIMYTGESINTETKEYAKNLFKTFNKNDVIKLLCFINEEEGIARGTIGQSVEAIISSLPSSKLYLTEIVEDNNIPLTIRQSAAFILLMNEGVSAIPLVKPLVNEGAWYVQEIINHLNQYGELNPYM
ncbi:MAG: DUF4365 domain-containing protein [Ignavibacteriales bacterium]|nr:DUF4365 domain-containing protein [Ignavibacteriales bacterium]